MNTSKPLHFKTFYLQFTWSLHIMFKHQKLVIYGWISLTMDFTGSSMKRLINQGMGLLHFPLNCPVEY